jgi:hypothetical protein
MERIISHQTVALECGRHPQTRALLDRLIALGPANGDCPAELAPGRSSARAGAERTAA